jgi:hypothetical protein
MMSVSYIGLIKVKPESVKPESAHISAYYIEAGRMDVSEAAPFLSLTPVKIHRKISPLTK